MSTTINNDTVVGMHYTLRDESGQILDSSRGEAAFQYLHGHSQIVPGLELALAGRIVGDKFSVEIAPEQGYGPYSADMTMQFSRSQFPEGATFEVGNEFELVGENQEILPARIIAVNEDTVTLDANHPLAGKKLFFEIEIASVREATKEELEHGHVHNEDDHHHHE
jgi:FKBP-type peptidyl-prolyl cis-trans isomerase SlyD